MDSKPIGANSYERILVTGGAGYVGAAVSRKLIQQGFEVIVYDNLSAGCREAVPSGALFIQGDIRNYRLLSETFQGYRIKAVIHCAAKMSDAESFIDPYSFYDNNVAGSLTLATACRDNLIKHIVFSATAADSANPYVQSKLMAEQIFKDGHTAYDLNYIHLQFINAAGAFVDGSHGPRGKSQANFFKIASQVALCIKPYLQIYGTDYDTYDGTIVRDFVHIEDVAEAHVLALKHLLRGGQSETLHCGYGRGYSVLDVAKTFKKMSGHDFEIVYGDRRLGELASLVTDPSYMQGILDWYPRFNDLELICKSALEWEMQLMRSLPYNLDRVQDLRPV
jgi:UDP-glucose 4-epimerase